MLCPACCTTKSHCLPHPPFPNRLKAPLQLLFVDVWGPFHVVFVSGFRYYLTIVHNFSRFSWLFPIQCKSAVLSIFIAFQRFVENLCSSKIVSIQIDGGGEFCFLHPHLLFAGITHRLSCPHSHAQNGTIEHKHRHIVETGLALLAHSHTPF